MSGRAMLEAIIAGQRNPTALARLARGTMRGKIARLEEALDCSFLTGAHVAILAMMLATIDYYTAQIEELTAKIEVLAGGPTCTRSGNSTPCTAPARSAPKTSSPRSART